MQQQGPTGDPHDIVANICDQAALLWQFAACTDEDGLILACTKAQMTDVPASQQWVQLSCCVAAAQQLLGHPAPCLQRGSAGAAWCG